MAYKKNKKPIKMAVGGAIASALMPFAQELLINKPARKKQEELERREMAMAKQKALSDRATGIMTNYPVHGIKSYSLGGEINMEENITQTGQETKISKDATKIEGAKHNQINPMTGDTGVPVDANNDGQQDIEVEEGEVVVNGYVFSAELGYAKDAEEISKELAVVDNEMLAGDRYSKNGYRRKKQILESNLEKLILMQEADKANKKAEAMELQLQQVNNPIQQEENTEEQTMPVTQEQSLVDPEQMPQMSLGGFLDSLKGIKEGMTDGQIKLQNDKFSSGVSRGANIASNLGQLLISENRKSPAKNRKLTPIFQKSNVNVSPQVQAVKSASRNAGRVASMYGSVQNAYGAARDAMAIESQALSEIYGNKQNIERDIEAKNISTAMDTDARNQQIESGNNAADFAIENAKQTGRQTIPSQISKNIQVMKAEDKQMELDALKMKYETMARTGGVNIPMESIEFAKIVESDPDYVKKYYDQLIQNKRAPEAEKLKTLFPSYFE